MSFPCRFDASFDVTEATVNVVGALGKCGRGSRSVGHLEVSMLKASWACARSIAVCLSACSSMG